MTGLVWFQVHADGSRGPVTRVDLVDGKLQPPDDGAAAILDGQRLRHPGLDDTALVDACDGWSNGWFCIRKAVP